MRKRGRLLALFAVTALASSRVIGQSDPTIDLAMAPPEQVQAYEAALAQGPEALVSFMTAFPSSPLVSSVIRQLAQLIGPEAAIQAALDAGVPTETVLAIASEIAPGMVSLTGQLTGGSTSPY